MPKLCVDYIKTHGLKFEKLSAPLEDLFEERKGRACGVDFGSSLVKFVFVIDKEDLELSHNK
jgi:hypothetical protein